MDRTCMDTNAGHGGQLERKKNINSKRLSSKEELVCKLLLVRCCAVQLLVKFELKIDTTKLQGYK